MGSVWLPWLLPPCPTCLVSLEVGCGISVDLTITSYHVGSVSFWDMLPLPDVREAQFEHDFLVRFTSKLGQ